jgi:hypothetical protein
MEKLAAHVRRDEVVPKSQNDSSVKHKKLLLMDHTIGSSRTNLQIRDEDLEIPGDFEMHNISSSLDHLLARFDVTASSL